MSLTALPQKRSLEERLQAVVPASANLSGSALFYHWLYDALTRYNYSKSHSAFVPFRSHFVTALNLRAGFSDFVEQELKFDTSIGMEVARAQIVRVISEVMTEAARDHAPYIADESLEELDHTIFDLFGVLYDLNPEKAFAWAVSALSPDSAFGRLKGPNGQPAPIFLRQSLRVDDTAGQMRAEYYFAMLNWCVEKRHLPGTGSAARTLLPLALKTSKNDASASRQIALFERLLEGQEAGEDLITRIDLLVDREGMKAMVREKKAIRDNLQLEVPRAIRAFDDESKSRWRLSYLIGDAFRAELEPPLLFVEEISAIEVGDPGIEIVEPYGPVSKPADTGSLMANLGREAVQKFNDFSSIFIFRDRESVGGRPI